MFMSHELDVTLSGSHHLHICFRALEPVFAEKRKRARWRPRWPTIQNLRYIRTTALGHSPQWCPPVHAIGPWRDILQVVPGAFKIRSANLRAKLDGTCGHLDISIELDNSAGQAATAVCADKRADFSVGLDGQLIAHLEIEDVLLWWPHTHGEPNLYSVTLEIGTAVVDLGRIGFRDISVDRDDDGKGFGLRINGIPVFCRGACWTNADIIGLSSTRETYLPGLLLMRDAGMNMLRLTGNMVYEGDEFYRLCDELGVMIWQDFMFANFDYPVADEAFMASVTSFARDHCALRRYRGGPASRHVRPAPKHVVE
jgi:beta-mannosidase